MACKNEKSPKKKMNVLTGKEELVHNINIGNMILNTFKSRPDFISQIDAATEEKTTFRQMRENSVKCALWLQKSFFRNVTISICTRNQMLACIPFLAGLYINATVNPWDEKYFDDTVRIMYFLVEYEPEVIFVDSSDYEHLTQVIKVLNKDEEIISPPKIVTFGKIEDAVSLESILNGDYDEAEIDEFSCVEIKPMDILAKLFSPNATSYPGKTHIRYFAFTYPSNQEVPAMSSDDIGLWYGSLAWDHNLILLVRSIVSYVTVIKSTKFTDEDMCKVIEKYKVKWVFLESSMCNQFFFQTSDISVYDVSSLRQFVFVNSAIHRNIYKSLVKHFTNASIIQVYSISEICVTATYQRSNDSNAVCSGYLAKNVQLMIRNIETKETIGSNALGEIWYRLTCKWCSPNTCTSPYCCNYKAKKDNINMKMFAAITNTWHCTEDYGYYEKDGRFYVIDKIKHLIKYKIFHISPLRIETVLQSHPAVSEVIVRSVSDKSGTDGQHPIAYVKKKSGAKVTEAELKKLVEKSLPNIYKLRGGVRFVMKMPYLPNGKIDRARITDRKSF